MLTVAVLGPVQVRRDGEPTPVPSGRTTEVLVRLALDAGLVVSAERLIEDLWADAAATGRNTLQSKVSQLRRALGDPGLVTSGHGGYTLAVGDDQVDALDVVRRAAAASAARHRGDAAAVLETTTEALGLFRGDALVDAGEGAWLQPHRARLEEVRLGLLEDQLAARVELGTGGDVVGELEQLVDRHPLREDLWASLVTALYRMGRQADALAAYQRVRRTLVEELGIEPGPRLRALEGKVLEQSITLDTACRTVSPGPVGNLPALASALVGRGEELTEVDRLMREQRLVTMVGPAGVGKTRTAIEVGRRMGAAGGVWLVRLDAADAAESIAQTVAETLHVAGGEQALVERFRGAETVLVLDNCEHVVDAAAELAMLLLDATTRLRVLATSQLPLGLPGETVYALEPLPASESVALFAGRAAQLRRQFVLDEETVAVVAEVCRALDGLPLAIELAAARVKSLSVQEIARRLDDRFALLQDPTSRAPERRRALAGAITWSYELLFPDDKTGLWALSCFAGGAPLAAAEHVLGALGVPRESVLDVVGRLVDRSLVSVEVVDDGVVRYRLLDSIGAFASARLRDSGRQAEAAAAHAAWFAAEAEQCGARVRGPEQPGCVALVRAERANIDAALAWTAKHDPLLGVRIANGFGWTWVVLGDGVAGAARVRGALLAADAVIGSRDRATGLLLAGWLEASAGAVGQADDDLLRALELAGDLGDDRLRADAHRHRAFLRIQQGRPHDVLEEATASLALYRSAELPWETAASLLLASFGSIMLGDVPGAAEAAGEALTLLTPLEDSWGLVHAQAMLGGVAQAAHRFDEAAASLSRAADESERLGFLGQTALHLTTLGRVQQRAGDDAAAAGTLERALEAANLSGDHRITATARVHLARLHRAAGRRETAVGLLEENDRWYRTAGGDGALLTRCLLASLAPEGEPATAELRAVLDAARTGEDPEVELLALDALARRAAERDEPEAALRLLGLADALLPQVRHLLDDADRYDAPRARDRLTGSHPPDSTPATAETGGAKK